MGFGGSGVASLAELLAGAAPGIISAVTGTTSGGAKGSLIGGTVQSAGGGVVMVKTTSGRLIAIRRKQHRRYHGGHRANRTDKLIEMMMIKSMMK